MRGDPPPKGCNWRESTLGSAAARRSYWFLWCESCRHRITIAAQELIDRGIPEGTPFWTLAQRLKCRACGSVKVGIQAASWDRRRDNPEQLS